MGDEYPNTLFDGELRFKTMSAKSPNVPGDL